MIKSNLEDYLETAPDEEYIAENAPAEDQAPETAKEAEEGRKVVKSILVGSPVKGVAADLSKVPDEAFAGRLMGDGAAVTPTDPIVCAPEDGEVIFVFDTKHAVGFSMDNGISVLIHMGVDTVKLEGKGFEVLTEQGAKVKKGDPLLKLDLEYLNANAPSMMSPVLCTELTDNQKIRLLKEGGIEKGENLFAVDIYE